MKWKLYRESSDEELQIQDEQCDLIYWLKEVMKNDNIKPHIAKNVTSFSYDSNVYIETKSGHNFVLKVEPL